ncbi:MAG: aldehyde ferredoxin oxidoreductase family protein [Planctomycetes bacterium]|nr:aldehyde ferredoxin oxidoreductase family protein [Planctomycetota bacterium]
MHGWMGKMAEVDLTTRQVKIIKGDPEQYKVYLGGRGLGARILYDRVDQKIKPFDPENCLVFTVGPLTSTSAPTSGRFSLTTKSPLTGTICESSSGEKWGWQLKKCGFDALIIRGSAKTPINVIINNDRIEFKDASDYWGQTVSATKKKILSQYGRNADFLSIGPAGENKVLISCIMNNGLRALGRGGLGAVMGSKNLKAIVIKESSRTVPVADSEKMKFVVAESNKMLRAHPITSKGLPEFGTTALVNIINEAGIFPTKNFQQSQFQDASKISGETIAKKIFVKRTGCAGCFIQCGRITRTKQNEGEGPEFESVWALGANCGVGDLETVANAAYLCNELGMDTISTGGVLACAMELNQRKKIKIDLKFGDGKKILKYIAKIATREGIGNEMAEGSKRFAKKYKSEAYAMQVKGLDLPAYDPRGSQGMGLSYATSPRGACHLKGGYMIGAEILGAPKMINRFTRTGKGSYLAEVQNQEAVIDSVIACRFATYALGAPYWARLLTAVTGITYTGEDLMTLGERIINLERLYNLREGFTCKDDTLPKRLMREKVSNGPAKGQVVDLKPMLEEYYQFRGWDTKGVPTKEKLKELNL